MPDMNDNNDATSPSSLPANHDIVTTQHHHHHRHFKMYKPAKVLTQFKFTHRKRKNRTLLGDVIPQDSLLPSSVMAIGRLDEDSEGLLLLTTDGKVSERVRRKSVEKEYYVQVDGQITLEAMDRLRHGVEISLPANNKQQLDNQDDDDACGLSMASPAASTSTYMTLPCKARLLDTSITTVENKPITATKEEEEEEDNQSLEPETKQQKKRKRRKKFGGTCNICKQTGHKARDCTENPIDSSQSSKNGYNNSANDNNNTVQLALPKGIPPPPTHHNGQYNIRHTTTSSRPTSWISITINEGKNRQVRRMTAAVGYPTLRLVRVRIGCVGLDGMGVGEVSELSCDVMDSITSFSDE
mmetsp:Transcript_28673/g.40982  ORF Transcript_28673/g.40982 Transcript_28673/m.40982 type:complete len:355 (-) Transcript_28673:54-1118(-)